MLLSALPFFFAKSNYLLISNKNQITNNNTTQIVLSQTSTKTFPVYLKYSFLGFNSWLVDLGCYETVFFFKSNVKTTQILWSLYLVGGVKLLTLSYSKNSKTQSQEKLFRNAKWLEREASEMNGWFFENKRDRRVLFLIPVFFSTPLKKSFPTGGFFEILLCPFSNKLSYKHVTWLS